MQLIVNGESADLGSDVLEDTVVELGFDKTRIVVAVNATFVPRSQWEHVSLKSDDRLEILSAIEGG